MASRHRGKQERLGVLRSALAGGLGEVPGATLEALAMGATQFIDDMEEQEVRTRGFAETPAFTVPAACPVP